MTVPYWTLNFEVCIHAICLLSTGERIELENDNNKVKTTVGPSLLPIKPLHKIPALTNLWGPDPVPPSRSALAIIGSGECYMTSEALWVAVTSQPIRFYTNLWPLYWIWLLPNHEIYVCIEHLRYLWHASKERLPFCIPGSVQFWPYICSYYWDHLFPNLPWFSRLFTSNSPRYFFDLTLRKS